MRKILVILALTAVTVMASAGDVFAQFRSGGGYRGSSGPSITIGNGGVRLSPGYNYGYGSNYGPGYYNGGGYYNGSGYYNGGNYYGSRYYSTPYYNTSPSYYVEPVIQQSNYYEPAVSQQVASVRVLVPRADAKVWFDGALTSQQGMDRVFNSPPLDPNSTYSYTIRARWMENGQSIERERQLNVRPGQSVIADFRSDSGESLVAPRGK